MKRALVILAVAVGMAACGSTARGDSSPQWLRVIHGGDNNYPLAVGKYCDTETGNLVYLYAGYRGGIAVVPGGCK